MKKTDGLPRYAKQQAALPVQTKLTAGETGCVLSVPELEIMICTKIALVCLVIYILRMLFCMRLLSVLLVCSDQLACCSVSFSPPRAVLFTNMIAARPL